VLATWKWSWRLACVKPGMGFGRRESVNQRAVFGSKQPELLPTVLMPILISCGLCNFSTVLIF
jgi:hypothetical protein